MKIWVLLTFISLSSLCELSIRFRIILDPYRRTHQRTKRWWGFHNHNTKTSTADTEALKRILAPIAMAIPQTLTYTEFPQKHLRKEKARNSLN